MKAMYVFSLLLIALACAARPQTVEPPSTPIKVSSQEALDHLLSKVVPAYPETGIANKIQNNELLMIVIGEKGDVIDAKVQSGHPAFAKLSLDAVKQWKYQPFMRNDAPVRVEALVLIQFRLAGMEGIAQDPGPDAAVSLLVVPRPPSADSRLRIKAEEMEGHRTKYVPPVYPPMARIAHIQGEVVLTAVIDKEGRIASLRAVSGHPILIQAALDAVRQWTYEPYLLNGEPVELESTVYVSFELPAQQRKR